MEKFISVDGGPIYIDLTTITHVTVTKADIEIHFVGGGSVVVADGLASVLGAIKDAKSVIV